MVTTGDTTCPPEKVYVKAPDGLRVNAPPGQIEPPDTLMVGLGYTVMEWLAELEQPFVLVPATLNVVLIGGVTVILALLEFVLQV